MWDVKNVRQTITIVQKTKQNVMRYMSVTYCRTPTFASDTFLENGANVESANVRALFQGEKGGHTVFSGV